MARVRVFVQAGDPISAVGLASYIRAQPGMLVVPSRLPADADVALTVTDRVNADFIGALTKAAQAAPLPTVVATDNVDPEQAPSLHRCRVVALLPRSAATSSRLASAVLDAAGGGAVPNLAEQAEELRREIAGPDGAMLAPRELTVLQLMADGHDTPEIADMMACSDRMVKSIILSATKRFNVHNRVHAVACALRAGLI
jgi:DNA-binding NarL/FixJ family response regulator